MKSKTLIDKQMKRKLNPELVDTIMEAKKNDKWVEVAGALSSPRKRKVSINLEQIDKESKEGDIIVVPGKVLSKGEISKRVRVVALSFSDEARKKLKEKKCEALSIKEEIKSNPKAQGIRVLR